MGTTLQNGVYLPSEGERNCYSGLANNWQTVDTNIGYVTALRQAIAGALTRQIVTQLPTEDIDPNCIYMILKATAQTSNIYDEYMYINSNWELIGDSQLDLSNYYTKQEVNQLPAVASGITGTKVGNYDTHIADGDIHVTANDKAKWNIVALIKQLRLVNAQVGSATTIAFADIDDTNGIKVGDKCMDLDAKLFEITAVDATNETVTVSSALIDIALDAGVVHNSGNETASGNKTWNGDTNCVGELNQTAPFKMTDNESFVSGNKNTRIYDQNGFQCANELIVYNNSKNIRRAWTVNNNSSGTVVSGGFNFILSATGQKVFYPISDNDTDNGSSSAYWKNLYTKLVNGKQPSALAMPDLDNGVDISSYITNLNRVANTYTPLANGWILIRVRKSTLDHVSIRMQQQNGLISSTETEDFSTWGCFLPVVASKAVEIYVYADGLASAYFYPCQGNI